MNGRDLPTRTGNEVKLLVAGGMIDFDTASAISSRDPFEPDNRSSRARAMIALPGALVLGADATAFIACNMSAIAQLHEPAVVRRALLSIVSGLYRLRLRRQRNMCPKEWKWRMHPGLYDLCSSQCPLYSSHHASVLSGRQCTTET